MLPLDTIETTVTPSMANFFSQLTNRLLQPAVDAQVERALNDKRPPVVGSTTITETSLTQAIGQPHDASYPLLYALYKLNTDVSGCAHKWAGGVTGASWRITTMEPDAKMTPALEEDIRKVTRWLKNPNPHKLFSSMLYEGVLNWGVVGNFYWHVTEDSKGQPLEIWPMHPALTRVVATKQGEVLGYVMRAPGEEPVVFDADEVLDFPLPNPTNDLYGESPLELVLEEAGIDLQSLRSNKAIFQNGLNPSAIILMDEKATPQQAKDVTDQLKQSHSGAANQHKLLALSRVKDYKPSTMSPRDLEFLKLRELATSKVTTAYRIPKVLLGHHNAGDYATTKFLIRETYSHVYRPMQMIIDELLTERLVHRFNPELRFELIKPDASDPDDIRKDQMQAKSVGILTADEVRSDSFGKEPLEEEHDAPTEADQTPDTDAGDTAEDAPDTAKAINKAFSKDGMRLLADAREREMEALAETIAPALSHFFTAQEQRFTEALTANALKTTTKSVDDYLKSLGESEDTLLFALLFGLLVSSLQSGIQAAQLQISLSLSTDVSSQIVQDYLNTTAARNVKGINQTTRDKLRATLKQGISNGEGVAKLKVRVAETFTDAKGYRSQLIARTETAQAYSYANEQALEATGVVTSYQWLTAGSDVCPICLPLNGVIRKAGKSYPGDLKPGFAHIQCRCSEIGLIDE